MPNRIWVRRVPSGEVSRSTARGEERRGRDRTCLTVMAGFQAFSSLRIDKQTVPDG